MDNKLRKEKLMNDINYFIKSNNIENVEINEIIFKNNRSFGIFNDLSCSHKQYERRLDIFKAGSYYCPICSENKRIDKVHDTSLNDQRKLNDFNLVQNYLNSINDKRKFKIFYNYDIDHYRLMIETNDNCGHENYKVRFDKFIKGSRCPHKDCRYKRYRNTKEINKRQEIINFVNNSEYKFYKDYNSSIIKMDKRGYKIQLKCPKCNDLFECMYYQLKNGKICPCSHPNSRAEERIEKFLKYNKIKFIREKTFKDLKYKSYLRFDFFLPEYNTCIEFDGIQHQKGWNKDSKSLKENIIRDNLKDNYCEVNNFNLIRLNNKDYYKLEEHLKLDLIELEILNE